MLSVRVHDYYGGEPWSAESKASRLGEKSGGGLGLLLVGALTDAWKLEPSTGAGSVLFFQVRSDA